MIWRKTGKPRPPFAGRLLHLARSIAPARFRASAQFNELVRTADDHRDHGRLAMAADGYRRALDLDPGRWDIWVQLGNMLKDSDRPRDAEEAFRTALSHAPNQADTHVQLGRTLRRLGRRGEALIAFTQALKIDNRSRDAIRELIAMGESWTVQQQFGMGAPNLQNLIELVESSRAALRRIESELPDVASLASFPLQRYDLFRRLYKAGLPPAHAAAQRLRLGIIALRPGTDAAQLGQIARSIAAQGHPAVQAVSAAAEESVARVAARYASSTPDRFLAPLVLRASTHPHVVAVEALARMPDAEWIILCRSPLLLDEAMGAWFAWTAANTGAVAAYCDEDHLGERVLDGWLRQSPEFKSALDRELLEQGVVTHQVMAVRADILGGILQELDSSAGAAEWWIDVLRRASDKGPIAHIPRVLASRFEAPSAPAMTTEGPQAVAATSSGTAQPIMVIIATRDGVELLRPCVDTLLATAAQPALVELVVIDNGSKDADTLSYLDTLSHSGKARVLRIDEPFNWARLNNLGAESGDAPYLLFANNDIEMLAPAWDDLLRNLLVRPDVGVVGGRLLYPDYTIQHAGIVLGTDHLTEHEGRDRPADDGGPGNRWRLRRRVGAVTGALMACRRDVFLSLGRFDERDLPIWFNDIDFCMRAWRSRLAVIYEPAFTALHHESKSTNREYMPMERDAVFAAAMNVMKQRWGAAVRVDPHFNPHFVRWGRPFEYLREPSREYQLEHIRRSVSPGLLWSARDASPSPATEDCNRPS